MEKRPKRHMLMIEVPREVHLDVKVLAHKRNMTMRGLIIALIAEAARKDRELDK